jgi:hypothetical protein
VVFTEEDKIFFEILRRKQIAAGNRDKKSVSEETSTLSFPWDNTATYAHSTKDIDNTHALASISTIRSPEWIVDYGASRNVTSNAREFSSYTNLAMLESI